MRGGSFAGSGDGHPAEEIWQEYCSYTGADSPNDGDGWDQSGTERSDGKTDAGTSNQEAAIVFPSTV